MKNVSAENRRRIEEAEGALDTPTQDYAATLVDKVGTRVPYDQLEGRQLGPYRVAHRIGGGGMGVIYGAFDTRLDRKVALKLLPPALSRSPSSRERFVREAKAASALDHPNICTVYDIGATDDGRMFIVMAYYAGETLADRLRRGPLPIEEARDLAIQVARGLQRAHAAGIVHRDVKPANVIVTEHGEAKILDFGVAQVAGDDGLTRSGAAPGTPAYMSPEQSRGDSVDARTDVWSLAAVLYEMITGRLPFSGRSEMAIYFAIQEREPDPLDHWREHVPGVLAKVVARCLAKDAGERYQSMAELLEVLDPLADRDTRAMLLRGGRTAGGIPEGVVVRTLMVTDLIDTNRLAEELGDDWLAEASAAYERKTRDLLAANDGLEIETGDGRASRTDGLGHEAGPETRVYGALALFERPVDAAACALACHRAAAELSAALDVELDARAGLHLGEVRLRRNAPEDVAGGAAPIEVEGAARPLAERVAALAGARQTLVTQSAFDLARDATCVGATPASSAEATPASAMRWVAHGDYLLEGVADPVAIFEVGAEGSAPLAPPADSEQARRVAGADGAVILGWRPAAGVPLPGRRHWLMREKVGEGGFGEVWLASHDKTSERRVFKFCYEAERLKALEREVTLFRLMKEALGRRDDIVRILDWNFEEAPYYLESEYTEGGDLVQWAAAQGGLDTVPVETRIELVAQVAEALAAAHSVGILHKDVKPANILIHAGADGELRARLTDFGVGLIADRSVLQHSGITMLGLTADGAHTTAGSQLYTAPEILEGKVPSVQADLYALGVMLYQMIVGDFQRALAHGWQREVDDEILEGDVACFADGSPERRPGSAQEIAERLRHLEERRARRRAAERERREAEAARRALKRGKRRRKILAAVSGLLAVFGVAMTYQVRRTRQEAARAEREAQAARQVSSFLEGMFRTVEPNQTHGETITAREILDRSAKRIEELEDQPEIQARLMDVMGGVYMDLGLYAAARPLFEDALGKRREIYGAEHPRVADSLQRLARCLWSLTRYQAAEPLFEDALAMRRRLFGEDHEEVAETLCELGDLQVETGSLEQAEASYAQCFEVRRQRFRAPHEKIAEAMHNLAWVKDFKRQDAAAEPLYRQALEMYREALGEEHTSVAVILNNYGYLVSRGGDAARAAAMFEEALSIQQQLAPEGSTWPVMQSNLAMARDAEGEHAEAERLAREASAALHERLGAEDWRTAYADGVLGSSLVGLARFAEAEPLLQASYGYMRANMNETFYAPQATDRLIALYDAWGRNDEAADYRAIREQYDS